MNLNIFPFMGLWKDEEEKEEDLFFKTEKITVK